MVYICQANQTRIDPLPEYERMRMRVACISIMAFDMKPSWASMRFFSYQFAIVSLPRAIDTSAAAPNDKIGEVLGTMTELPEAKGCGLNLPKMRKSMS